MLQEMTQIYNIEFTIYNQIPESPKFLQNNPLNLS